MLPNPDHLDHWITSIPESPDNDELMDYLAELSDYEISLQYHELKGNEQDD